MRKLIHLLVLISFLSSCNRGLKDDTKGVQNIIKYASFLEIYPMKGYIQVHIIDPTTKKKTYLSLSRTSPRFSQDFETRIKTPVRSMITLSGTHIGMLAVLNETGRIKGVTNRNYIYNKSVLKGIEKGKIIAFDNEESIPVESIIRAKAQLLIYSGFGHEFPHQKQLKRMGTLCIPNYDWKEVHPLGKAEWIKLFGYLTGKEKEADAYFNRIEKEYNDLKAQGQKFKVQPTIFSGNTFGDIWFCPAGESFNARMIDDAGGDYKYLATKGTGSLELSLEKVFSDNARSDIWINPGISTLSELQRSNPKAELFEAYKNGKVFCYSPDMNHFWEMSAIEPHHVLSDLLSIFHPGSIKNKRYFYQKLK